jgi:hypothetical protein
MNRQKQGWELIKLLLPFTEARSIQQLKPFRNFYAMGSNGELPFQLMFAIFIIFVVFHMDLLYEPLCSRGRCRLRRKHRPGDDLALHSFDLRRIQGLGFKQLFRCPLK